MGILDKDVDGVTRTGTAGATEFSGLNANEYSSNWSNDVTATAFGSWISHTIGPQTENLRTIVRFDIAGLAVDAPIVKLELLANCPSRVANSADSYYIGPYNGDGRANPTADSAAVAYGRANVGSDFYRSADTLLRLEGNYTWDLGGQAIVDLLAARAVGTIFSVALRQTDETGTQHYSTIDGWTQPLPPKLRVTLGTAVSVVVAASLEAVSGLTKQIVPSIETLASLAKTAGANVEALSSAAKSVGINVESISGVPVSVVSGLSLEALQTIAGAANLHIEANSQAGIQALVTELTATFRVRQALGVNLKIN